MKIMRRTAILMTSIGATFSGGFQAFAGLPGDIIIEPSKLCEVTLFDGVGAVTITSDDLGIVPVTGLPAPSADFVAAGFPGFTEGEPIVVPTCWVLADWITLEDGSLTQECPAGTIELPGELVDLVPACNQ